MESLALIVVALLVLAIFSGPIALFLTWLPAINGEGVSAGFQIVRRIFVTIFALIGSFISFIWFISSTNLVVTLISVFGSVTAFFAVKREYFPDGLGLGKRNGNGFGRRGDRRNGPDGQH